MTEPQRTATQEAQRQAEPPKRLPLLARQAWNLAQSLAAFVAHGWHQYSPRTGWWTAPASLVVFFACRRRLSFSAASPCAAGAESQPR